MIFHTLPQWVQTLATVAGSSLVASVYYWWTQRAGVENSEPFKPEKAGVTMGVAFALSLVLYGTGTVVGLEALLAHLSVGVGPIALWIQTGIKQYRRTGEINITNGDLDEAAEALADALGISVADLLALAAGRPSEFEFGDGRGANTATDDTPSRNSDTPDKRDPAAENN